MTLTSLFLRLDTRIGGMAFLINSSVISLPEEIKYVLCLAAIEQLHAQHLVSE